MTTASTSAITWLLRSASLMTIHARCLDQAGQRSMAEDLRRDSQEVRDTVRLLRRQLRMTLAPIGAGLHATDACPDYGTQPGATHSPACGALDGPPTVTIESPHGYPVTVAAPDDEYWCDHCGEPVEPRLAPAVDQWQWSHQPAGWPSGRWWLCKREYTFASWHGSETVPAELIPAATTADADHA